MFRRAVTSLSYEEGGAPRKGASLSTSIRIDVAGSTVAVRLQEHPVGRTVANDSLGHEDRGGTRESFSLRDGTSAALRGVQAR